VDKDLKGFSIYASMGLDEELLEAAAGGDARKVRELLGRGANPNARDRFGRTPLHLAALNGHAEVAGLLLDRGADVNAIDEDGETPLHKAAYKGRMNVVRLLLERGADVDVIEKYGRTPSDVARTQGYIGIARVIEEYSRRRAGTRKCPVCGAPAEPGAKYCWKCGAKLA